MHCPVQEPNRGPTVLQMQNCVLVHGASRDDDIKDTTERHAECGHRTNNFTTTIRRSYKRSYAATLIVPPTVHAFSVRVEYARQRFLVQTFNSGSKPLCICRTSENKSKTFYVTKPHGEQNLKIFYLQSSSRRVTKLAKNPTYQLKEVNFFKTTSGVLGDDESLCILSGLECKSTRPDVSAFSQSRFFGDFKMNADPPTASFRIASLPDDSPCSLTRGDWSL